MVAIAENMTAANGRQTSTKEKAVSPVSSKSFSSAPILEAQHGGEGGDWTKGKKQVTTLLPCTNLKVMGKA